MMSADEFMSAFALCGLTKTATAHGQTFTADKRENDDLILGGMGQSHSTLIEYATGAITLVRGDSVVVDGQTYRVKETKQLDGGEFSQSILE